MKALFLLFTFAFTICFADTKSNVYNINEADQYGYIFITNTLAKDVYLISANKENSYRYAKFNCFIPIPKDDQNFAPSPSFETIKFKDFSAEGTKIETGQTVVYAINTVCDKNVEKYKDHFEIRFTDINSKESILYYRDLRINESKHILDGGVMLATYPMLLGYIPTGSIQMSIVILPKMK